MREHRRKMASRGGRIAGTIKSLVNARGLQAECARFLHESLLVAILMYSSETMIWKEKKRSRIRAVHIDNLRGWVGIKRIDRFPNAQIRELCEVTKGVNERIYEGVLRCFGNDYY